MHLNFIPITSSHHCALISPRLHRWNFPDSKQRPILLLLSPLTLMRRAAKRFPSCRLMLVRCLHTPTGWGEPKAKRKYCTRSPLREKESHPLFSNNHTQPHSLAHQQTRERPRVCWCDITLTPLRFNFFLFITVDVCVCEWSSHACG